MKPVKIYVREKQNEWMCENEVHNVKEIRKKREKVYMRERKEQESACVEASEIE